MTDKEIETEFGEYKPPKWMIKIIHKINKKFAEKLLNRVVDCALQSEIRIDQYKYFYGSIKDIEESIGIKTEEDGRE
jgi:hypothetical protein